MKFQKQQDKLEKRKSSNSLRSLDFENDLEDFCSNDYLGIARVNVNHFNDVPSGSTGSRLLTGNYTLIEELESSICEVHKSSNSLVFSSGYTANVGLLSSVPQKGDTIFYDELIHASVKDGMRLSFASSYSFKHNDVHHLKKKLSRATGEVFVVVESVYSMDGDAAPLTELCDLSEELGFVLVVDEAHGVGVHGEKGEGLVVELGLEQKVDIRVVTFGKALGCHGAAVLCSSLIKNYLINFSRAFIYSTAPSPQSVKAVQQAYQLMTLGQYQPLIREKIALFKEQARGKFELIVSNSAIQCVVLGSNYRAKECALFIQKKGFDVRPILSPTVPKGKERVRICLHVFNSNAKIIALVDVISAYFDNSH